MFYKTIKLLEENTDAKLFNKSMAMIFESDTKSKRNKSRNKQERLLKSFWTAKKTITQKENYRMGGNICKWYIDESESHSVVSDTLWPLGLYSPWNSPGQNTGVGSLSLLQRMFPTQELNPGLLHCGQILYQLSHKGSPMCTQSQGAHNPIRNNLLPIVWGMSPKS